RAFSLASNFFRAACHWRAEATRGRVVDVFFLTISVRYTQRLLGGQLSTRLAWARTREKACLPGCSSTTYLNGLFGRSNRWDTIAMRTARKSRGKNAELVRTCRRGRGAPPRRRVVLLESSRGPGRENSVHGAAPASRGSLDVVHGGIVRWTGSIHSRTWVPT